MGSKSILYSKREKSGTVVFGDIHRVELSELDREVGRECLLPAILRRNNRSDQDADKLQAIGRSVIGIVAIA